MPTIAARLFRAVVVSGVALTAGCQGESGVPAPTSAVPHTGDEASPSPQPPAPEPTEAAAPALTAEIDAAAPPPLDASAPVTHADASAPRPRASHGARTCPPGSELKFPPCYLIL